jgi:hypothetical protein
MGDRMRDVIAPDERAGVGRYRQARLQPVGCANSVGAWIAAIEAGWPMVCLRGANAALARRRMRWGTETDGIGGQLPFQALRFRVHARARVAEDQAGAQVGSRHLLGGLLQSRWLASARGRVGGCAWPGRLSTSRFGACARCCRSSGARSARRSWRSWRCVMSSRSRGAARAARESSGADRALLATLSHALPRRA